MTQYQLLWVIALTALLAAPAGVLLYSLTVRCRKVLAQRLPPRHLISRGQRLRSTADGEVSR